MIAVSLLPLVGDYLFNQRIDEDVNFTRQLAGEAARPLADSDAEALYAMARAASELHQGRMLVLDPYGVVMTDSASEYNGRLMQQREARLALAGETGAYGFYQMRENVTAGQGITWLGFLRFGRNVGTMLVGQYAAPIVWGDRQIGALLYLVRAQDMYDNLLELQDRMLLWFVGVAVAVSVLSLVLSRLITNPINKLDEGIMWISRGDFSHRVAIGGYSEFAQLASAFNMMSERLHNLDRLRNQFVSNASHELKTPLSTMKILLETLLYQQDYDPDIQKEFLTDINTEIDRLNMVISDLLTLVSIDSGEIRLRLSDVALDELVSDTVKRLSPLANERGIELEMSVTAPESLIIEADPMRLSQVVYNLIDNGVKYTQRGGKVRVTLGKEGKDAVIRVIDNGIGIPEDDILHVFDRFYRVDKARSRGTGGTGLGLSIVKQMILLHGGNVLVESEEDKGTTFTVVLPL